MIRKMATVAAGVFLFVGCSDDEPTRPPIDVAPPAVITDLSFEFTEHDELFLHWTAPGDDGNEGTAEVYELRGTRTDLDPSFENMVGQVSGMPCPSAAGASESVKLESEFRVGDWEFWVRAADSEGNWAEFSNAVSVTNPGGVAYGLATTPDFLVANFLAAYRDLNFVEYDALLHDDFLFYFAPEDVGLSPSGQGFWERTEEALSAARMLAGESGWNRFGQERPGVQTISLSLTPLQPSWEDASGEGAEFLGTLKRRFAAELYVTYQSEDLVTDSVGEQVFYAKPETRWVQGVQLELYRLVFWRDLARPAPKSVARSGLSAVVPATWSAFKSVFYLPEL